MYYGCIVIAEEQPDHWFAATSPAFIMKDWRRLPDLLDELLEDPQRMSALQQKSLDYWNSTLAPAAVSLHMFQCLQRLEPELSDNQDSVSDIDIAA